MSHGDFQVKHLEDFYLRRIAGSGLPAGFWGRGGWLGGFVDMVRKLIFISAGKTTMIRLAGKGSWSNRF